MQEVNGKHYYDHYRWKKNDEGSQEEIGTAHADDTLRFDGSIRVFSTFENIRKWRKLEKLIHPNSLLFTGNRNTTINAWVRYHRVDYSKLYEPVRIHCPISCIAWYTE